MATKATTPEPTPLDKIAEWARAEEGVSVADDGTITVEGDSELTIAVSADDERISMVHEHAETTSDPARVAAVRAALPGRGSPVTGTLSAGRTRLTATLTSTLYVDGLNRQAFVTGLNGLIAAADALTTASADSRRQGTAAPTAGDEAVADLVESAADAVAGEAGSIVQEALSEEEAAALAEAEEAEARAAAEEAAAQQAARAAQAAATVGAAVGAWSPTHKVPEGGMRAWPEPNPALPPAADLQARVELTIAEKRGDWARVVGSNGWTGWVDARRLAPIGAATATPASSAAGASGASSTTFPIAAIGGIAVAIAAFLPWFSLDTFDANSFEVALPFLWDLHASGQPALGYLVAALGALGLLAPFVEQIPSGARRFAGVASVAVAALYVFQVNRGLGTGLGDTIDTVGYGVYVALAGGLALMAAPTSKP